VTAEDLERLVDRAARGLAALLAVQEAVADASVNALARVGLVRVQERDGRVVWPVRVCPPETWRWMIRSDEPVGVFRNLPGVVRRVPGRLLPRRWGFYVLGLEVGDRGGPGRYLVLRRRGLPVRRPEGR
jgi:hypothetical protein